MAAGARISENNSFTEMCSGPEAGSHLRRIDFVYHSTLGLRVKKKKKKDTVLRVSRKHRFRSVGAFTPGYRWK